MPGTTPLHPPMETYFVRKWVNNAKLARYFINSVVSNDSILPFLWIVIRSDVWDVLV